MYGQVIAEWFSPLQLKQPEPMPGTLKSRQKFTLEKMAVRQKGNHANTNTQTLKANLELLVCLPACFCSLETGVTEESRGITRRRKNKTPHRQQPELTIELWNCGGITLPACCLSDNFFTLKYVPLFNT